MEAMENQARQQVVETVAGAGGFVAVDDAGEFTFYPSEAALLADFEYPAEAICIVGRDGGGFRLVLDAERKLDMATGLGPVDYSWLRQAWLRAQRHNPAQYPLRRFYPAGRDTLLACMFETLYLENALEAVEWQLLMNGTETHPVTLRDVDARLATRGSLEQARVRDPFGHHYRPVRVPGHPARSGGRHGNVTIYAEIAAAVREA